MNYRKLCNEWTNDYYSNNRYISVDYTMPRMKNYPSHCIPMPSYETPWKYVTGKFTTENMKCAIKDEEPARPCKALETSKLVMSLSPHQMQVLNQACKHPRIYWEFVEQPEKSTKTGISLIHRWLKNRNVTNGETAFLIDCGYGMDSNFEIDGLMMTTEELREELITNTYTGWIVKNDHMISNGIAEVSFKPMSAKHYESASNFFTKEECIIQNNNDRYGRTGNPKACEYFNKGKGMPSNFTFRDKNQIYKFLESGGELLSYLMYMA